MGMTVDISDFEKGFRQLVEEAVPGDVAKGMFKAAQALLRDAKNEVPKAPRKIGDLRAAAHISPPKIRRGETEIEAGFNIVYAARWHELSPAEDARINWTLPGSGRKYLESKMARNTARYLAIIGEFIKRRLGG